MTIAEKIFIQGFAKDGIKIESEYRFHPKRKWRFDLAIVSEKIAIEVEGGIYMKKGGHSSIKGILRDIEKYNAAVMLGWAVYRVQPENLTKLETIDNIKQLYLERKK